MNIPELLEHFDNWTRSGNGKYHATCPMPDHEDSSPSVSITQDAVTGKILIFCWGCNTRAPELVTALGLTLSDLQGDPGHPSAVQQTQNNAEISPEDQIALEQRIKAAMGRLEEAEGYIQQRFGLSLEDGRTLGLGVDTDFGVPHLIIPFYDPSGKIVGMQGRRLVEGEPRWRSVSGGGWSKIGAFGWNEYQYNLETGELNPIVISEGPSDALAVVGKANLPAIAVRGASNTSSGVIGQLKEWLGNRPAVVIGDNDEAGKKFAESISEGISIPSWNLPEEYNDIDSYLSDGNILDISADSSEIAPTETPEEQSERLRIVIETDLDRACYNEELKQELSELPTWQIDSIFGDIVSNAGYGQRTIVRQRINALQRAIRDVPVPGGHGVGGAGGGGIHAPIPQGFNPGDLPTIIWNAEDQLQFTEDSIRNAMDAYTQGSFYRSASGQYLKVVEDELVNLKEAGVKSMLSQMAHWRIINGQRETGHVPPEAARLITDPSWQSGLPEIKRRVEVPFMLSGGEIISTIGFHEGSGVYLLPRIGDYIEVPPVPAIITQADVEKAKQILEDVTEGFMFKDQASKTNLIAMTLTSPLRELFSSNPMVPMLTSTAPQSGSGKGTSIRVPLSTAGVGPYSLSTTAYNPDENEFEKKLVGKLLKKSTYIFLDNIRGTVSSSVLEQMLTAANYDGRTLGYSEVNALSTLVLWTCTLQSTGSFNRDLTRRCVPVELIKNYRGKWKHKNIEAYLASKRGEMIWACFVVARKWIQDGAPISEARLDGYGGWTEVIGGIIEHVLHYEDFLGNLVEFRVAQDENAMTVDGLLERWLNLYGENPMPARMAIEDYEDPALHQMLNIHNPSTRQTIQALTRVLDSQRGYIIGTTHMWTPLGLQQFGQEGMLKMYKCEPLPEEDE
jgi:hypothetical protein